MAAFVVVVAVSAASPNGRRLVAGSAAAAGSQTMAAGVTGAPVAQPAYSGTTHRPSRPAAAGHTRTKPASAVLDARLAAALQPIAGADRAQFSVGVIDTTTGAEALYHATRRFHAASIMKADILAALLLEHQQVGTTVSSEQADLAATMMDDSSDTAATQLWSAIGGQSGMAALNQLLKLRHTSPGSGVSWGLTRTTVADQLQLLTDLVSPRSPLASAGRDYELGLMANVAASQRWGVSAAASNGTSYAVKNGWLPDPELWVINSIGIVKHDGQVLLIAVLSRHNPTETGGIALAQAAATAAAKVITSAAS